MITEFHTERFARKFAESRKATIPGYEARVLFADGRWVVMDNDTGEAALAREEAVLRAAYRRMK